MVLWGDRGRRLLRCRGRLGLLDFLHLVTQLFGSALELFLQTRTHLLGVSGFLLFHVGDAVPHQIVKDTRQFVRRRGDRFRRPQTRTLTTQVGAEVALAAQQTPRRQKQGVPRPILAPTGTTRLYFAAGLFPVGTQTKPTGEMLDRRPFREVA